MMNQDSMVTEISNTIYTNTFQPNLTNPATTYQEINTLKVCNFVSVARRPSSEEVVLVKLPRKMGSRICLLFLLLLGTTITLADIAMQENLDKIATEVNFRFIERL